MTTRASRARRALLALVLLLSTFVPAAPAPAQPATAPERASTTPAPTRPVQVIPGATSGPPPAPVRAPAVKAEAFVLADAETGQVLLARDADRARPMASTTKVMTALLALEELDLNQKVTIGPGPVRIGEESLRLRVGERLTVRQLLEGLLLKSANDAAVALAEAVDGSEEKFVRRMNARARELGLTRTRYVTAYGLDRPGHATSARDLARLWNAAMRNPAFRALAGQRTARLPGDAAFRSFEHTATPLFDDYRWVLGGKTGWTNQAGRCLVVSAHRGGRTLVVAVLGSPNAFPDVRALLDYGFTQLVRARVAEAGQTVEVAAAGNGDGATPGRWRFERTIDALVPRDQLGAVRLLVNAKPGQAEATGTLLAGRQVLARTRLVPVDATPSSEPPASPRATAVPAGVTPDVIDPFLADGTDGS